MTLPALAAFLICLATEADAPEFISDGFKRGGVGTWGQLHLRHD